MSIEKIALLERMAALRRDGALSEAEYVAQKQDFLRSFDGHGRRRESLPPNNTPATNRRLPVLLAVALLVAVLAGTCLIIYWTADFRVAPLPKQSAGQEAAKQYEIVAKSGGAAVETCKMAGRVAAAYLEDKNEVDYASWKAREGQECARYDSEEKFKQAIKGADDAMRDLYSGR